VALITRIALSAPPLAQEADEDYKGNSRVDLIDSTGVVGPKRTNTTGRNRFSVHLGPLALQFRARIICAASGCIEMLTSLGEAAHDIHQFDTRRMGVDGEMTVSVLGGTVTFVERWGA